MKKCVLALSFLVLTTGIGCSKKPSSKEPVGGGLGEIARPDLTPPRLSDVAVGPYYDELHEKKISRLELGNTHFRRYITNWKVEPTQRDDQKAFLSHERQLPYFIITVDDVDTPLENLTLYYAFEREDDEKAPLSYLVAEKYKFGKINQWLIVLSEETAGSTLTSFSGERNFALHLKAVDAGNHETKGVFPFVVTNLQPLLNIYKDPNYMDDHNYPEALSDHVFWKKENLEKNLALLREGKTVPVLSSLFLFKFVIENDQPFEMWVRLAFQKAYLNYAFEKHFEKREGGNFQAVKLYSKSRSRAPVSIFMQIGNEKEMPFEDRVSPSFLAYRLPPADPSLGEKGKSRLYVYMGSDLRFKHEHPAESNAQAGISENLIVDRVSLEGNIAVRSAPAGLPSSYYEKDANWLDQSGRLDFECSLVSNK